MEKLLMKINETVQAIDSKNAEYIMADHFFESKVNTAVSFYQDGNEKMVGHMMDEIEKFAKEYDAKNLTPANTEVGDGVTMTLYSDAHAWTVIKKTKTSVTIQRDNATMDPNFKPEFVVGGFAGHCTNQEKQVYTYERNENGETVTFRWSKKYNRYKNQQRGQSLIKGRKEFYDYNF